MVYTYLFMYMFFISMYNSNYVMSMQFSNKVEHEYVIER